ncbi:hypothetical protein COLO4_33618 [Corchorus olitorius]|uniref:Uncharacterized protein n=1 Tax=Corchorus olitorius TaxID=93759 RepID=A0A1R3GSE4_9ROSI|nr:hypothetical protein COLO4_33618 [Corchorus olitorius]
MEHPLFSSTRYPSPPANRAKKIRVLRLGKRLISTPKVASVEFELGIGEIEQIWLAGIWISGSHICCPKLLAKLAGSTASQALRACKLARPGGLPASARATARPGS